jgi:hypothetical protein
MKKIVSSGQARSSHPFAMICLLVLIFSAGCGNETDEEDATAGSVVFAAPILKSPASGAAIDVSNPVVEWFGVPSAVSFQVEISVRDDFNVPELVDDVPVTSFMISDFTLREGTHFWRVRARDSSGVWSPWSMVSSFVVAVDRTAKGDRAFITRPSGDTTIFTRGEIMFLAAVPDAPDRCRCFWDFGELGSYSGTTAPAPVKFDRPGTYTVRFTASDAAGMEYADEVKVSVVDECPDLLEPADGYSTGEDSVDFSWSPVTGASSYILFIPSNGTSPERSIQMLETSRRESGFEPGDYLWWVYAVDSQGNLSSCPTPRVFSIREAEVDDANDFIQAMASLLKAPRDPQPMEVAQGLGPYSTLPMR